MKVRIVQQMSGTRSDGYPWPAANAILVVGDREGAELCAAGIAEPVAEHRTAETSESKIPPETRVQRPKPPPAPPLPPPVIPPAPAPPAAAPSAAGEDVNETTLIRDWAKSKGLTVGDRGRIPQDVKDRYFADVKKG